MHAVGVSDWFSDKVAFATRLDGLALDMVSNIYAG